jgi:hypothetical protein
MSNLPLDQKLAFDTQMVVTGPLTGTPQLLGVLQNEPVMILFKNQTTVTVFLADNAGATKGTTMGASEEIILDCRANHGRADNMGFPIGTPFYVTGTGGSGSFYVSILYAK